MSQDHLAEQTARALVQMDYPRDEIKRVMRERFPDADVDLLIDQAQADADDLDDQLAEAQTRNEMTED